MRQSPTTEGAPGSRDALLGGLMLLVLWLAVYARATENGYVNWDDNALVIDNPLLRADGWPRVRASWFAPYEGLYSPLTFTAEAMVAAAGRAAGLGLRPGVFHAASVLLHGIGTVFVWRLLLRCSGGVWPATAGAAVWLVHPLQVETVAWASGFNGLLAGMLAMAALWADAAAFDPRRRRLWPWLGLSAGLFALSLLAKPSGTLLPVGAFGLNVFVLRRPWRESLLVFTCGMIIAIPFCAVSVGAQTDGIDNVATPALSLRPLVALDAMGFYFEKVIWPVRVATDYGRTPAVALRQIDWTGRALVLALAVASTVMALRFGRWWAVGALFLFLSAVAPVLGLVPFYYQFFSTVADRYAYAGMVGVALGVALAVRGLRRAAAVAMAVPVVSALALLSWRQVAVWHDTETLFRHALVVQPDSIAANEQLGSLASRRHDVLYAEAAYRRVLGLVPGRSALRQQLGELLIDSGRPAAAIPELKHVVAELPIDPTAYADLGRACLEAGQYELARDALLRSIRLDPDVAATRARLGVALFRLDDPAAADDAISAALRLDPDQPIARALRAELRARSPVATYPYGR